MKLSFFDKKRETQIIVDASPVGLGAILTQKDKTQKNHVVMFASKTLSDVEKRYCQTEIEKEKTILLIHCQSYQLSKNIQTHSMKMRSTTLMR